VNSGLVVLWTGSRVISKSPEALTIPALMVLVAVVLTLHGAISFLAESAVAPKVPVRTNYSVSANLRQDLLLWLALVVLACLLPLTLMARVAPADRNLAGYSSVVLAFVPLFAVLVCAFAFAAHNSSHHLSREIGRLSTDKAAVRSRLDDERGVVSSFRVLGRAARHGLEAPQSDRFLRVLSAHLQVQNLVGRLLLTPTVAGLLALFLSNPKQSGVAVTDRDR
jgi:hypothetical protein